MECDGILLYYLQLIHYWRNAFSHADGESIDESVEEIKEIINNVLGYLNKKQKTEKQEKFKINPIKNNKHKK